MYILTFSIFTFLIIELLIFFIFKKFKKNFQWLIDNSDLYPKFSNGLIKKYNEKIFNKDLGWDNQTNKKSSEIILKDKRFKFEYNFDKEGSRITGNNFKTEKISFFGDSYAFCRCSQDNQTIQHYLEKKLKYKIKNYGVGNYGLDQVYLKIKKKINNTSKSKNIIIVFVPETISRIHSYWKHYLEFGNILGFKPKFKIKNEKIILEKKHLSKLNQIDINKKIKILQNKDIFFEKKFLKNMFIFPYLFSFLKNTKKNSLIFYYLFLKKIFNDKKYYERAFSVVVKNNLIESQKLYNEKEYNTLLEKIIVEINKYLKKKKKNVFFFVLPQLFDLKLNSKLIHSSNFFNSISQKYNFKIFDLTLEMRNISNIEKYYFDDFYGGHLNYRGNKLVSSIILNKVKDLL